MDLGTIIAILLILAIVIPEWRYRAKRDGAKHATGAFIFAGIIFALGTGLQHLMGIWGLTLLMSFLVIATGAALIRRVRKA